MGREILAETFIFYIFLCKILTPFISAFKEYYNTRFFEKKQTNKQNVNTHEKTITATAITITK